MKKLTALLLALIMCLSFAACGDEGGVTVDGIKNHTTNYLVEYFEDESLGEVTEYEEKDGAVAFNYCDDLAWVVIGTEDGAVKNISANVYLYRLEQAGYSEPMAMAVALAPIPASAVYQGGDPVALFEALINDEDMTVENNGWEFSLTLNDSYLAISAEKID